MALGFNYTLSVNESKSLTDLDEFLKKVSGKNVKIGLDFDLDSFNSMIDKIQDKLDDISGKLKLEFGDFDVDVEALQTKLRKVGDKVKLNIPAEIEVKEHDIKKPLETTGSDVGKSVGKSIGEIQDSLILALNNLSSKVAKNGLEDLIPVDDIKKSIDELNKSGLEMQEVNKQARLIKQEIQAWSQVTTAQNKLFETTATKANQVAKVVNQMNQNSKQDDIDRKIKKLQQQLDAQIDNIKASKEFSRLTQQQRDDFNRLEVAMTVTGNSLKEVRNNYEDLNHELKEFERLNIGPLVEKQENAFSKLFATMSAGSIIYNGITAAMNGVQSAFRDAVDFAYELDEAYTNINQTMTISKSDFEEWVDEATKVANSTGTLTGEVLTMMKTYASAGETIDNINAKLAGTTAFQNVTGLAAADVTNSVQSIMNQYKLAQGTAEEIANSMQYLGDVMVGVAYKLKKEESLAMQDVIAGVEGAGSVINNAGGSFEWFASVVGTLSEQMNATGDETANAMKMIAARTLQSKEAIADLVEEGEDLEELELAASNAEKALGGIGISVRTQTGEFKGLEEILGEVAAKWDTLNNTQQQLVSEKLAGNNRRNYFIALMEDYDRVIELQQAASDSTGAMMEASQKQAESLEGVTNQLKNTMTEMYQGIISSDALKDAIKIANGFLQSLTKIAPIISSSLIPALASATAMFVAFDLAVKGSDGKIIGFGNNVVKAVGKIKTLITQMGLWKTAMIGAAGVLTGVLVFGIQQFIKKAKEKQEHIDGITDAMKQYKETAKEAESTDEKINDYKDLHDELKNMNTTEERKLEIEQEIASIRDELASDSRFKNILDDETKSVQEQVAAMKELSKYDQQQNARQLLENTDLSDRDVYTMANGLTNKANSIKAWEDDLNELQAQYDELVAKQSNLTEGSKEWNKAQKEINKLNSDMTNTQQKLLNAQDELVDDYETLQAYQEAGKAASEVGIINTRQEVKSLEANKDIYEQILGIKQDSLDTTKEEAKAEQDKTDLIKQQLDAQAKENDSGLSETVKQQEDLNKRYLESLNYLEEAQELINKMKDGLSLDDMNTILDSDLMEDFTGAIDNADQVVEHLKGKMSEMQDIAYETYAEMMLADDEYWNNAMTKCAEALGINAEQFVNYVNEKGLARQVDITNAENAADAENQMNTNLAKQLISAYASVVNEKGDDRKIDMQNVANFLNTQEAKEAQTIEELKNAWAAYYKAKVSAVQREYLDLKNSIKDMDAGQVDPEIMKHLNNLNQEIQGWYNTNKNMQDYFKDISTAFTGVSGGLSQAVAGASQAIAGASKPSYSSGSGGSSGSTTTQREVADMEDLVDRYYQFNDAIKTVTKQLDKNRQKQAQVTTKQEYKKLVQEEIDLINKQIKALQNLQKEQEKERNELKATLQSNGFSFDSNGNITNYAKRLEQLTNYANSLSDPDQKQAAINNVKAINEIINAYTQLEDDTLPGTSSEIENLKQEIVSINKELEQNLELIDQLGDRYFDVLSKLADIENKLAMNDKLQANSVGLKKIQLMKDEILLIKEKQKLLEDQRAQSEAEAKKLQQQLKNEGVTFDNNGNIANYDAITKNLTDKANNLVGESQQDALEHAEKILDLIDQYMTLTDETIPGLEQEWMDYANTVQDIEREMKDLVVDMQKQVTEAYENEQNKRYQALKDNLKKEQDALNKAYEEESYQKGLNEQQRALDEIAQQIAIYSRDGSEAGKARLEQLKKEYEAQQEAINEMIRENEKKLSDERFAEEETKLDDELAEILAPENLVAAVNEAITSGMVTVGDEVIKLSDLMSDWMNESGDGLYALGGVIKEELIANLEAAAELMRETGILGVSDVSSRLKSINESRDSGSTVNFNQPLVLVESMSADTDLEAFATTIKNEVYGAINEALR